MKEFSWEGLPFVKMSASGNDFILINNFKALVPPTLAPLLAQKLCPRAISVGADGLILIEPPEERPLFPGVFITRTEAKRKCAETVAVVQPVLP